MYTAARENSSRKYLIELIEILKRFKRDVQKAITVKTANPDQIGDIE